MVRILADSEASSSSDSEPEYGDGGAPGRARSPDPPSPSHPDPPAQDSPGPSPGHPDEPEMSDDGPEYPDCEGLGSMSSHLAKLDRLSARGCADKFFEVHTVRWGPSMPRPGDYLHSARAGEPDVREGRK